MYFSRYIKQFSSDDPAYCLLYSVKKGASVLLHKEAMKAVLDASNPSSTQKTLSELGFLVDDIEEEKREMLAFLDTVNKNSKQFKAVIILNLECNLNCVYCYEGNLKGRLHMSQDTADDIIAFIKRQYPGRVDTVRLVFYGGEPLLSTELIKYISVGLMQAASGRNIKYACELVTNGTLLTRKLVEELLPFGLIQATTSLDGPKEIHNCFRPFATGAGTFDIIIKNIKETFDLISIDISGAFTRDNYREFPKLLDFLIAEGITPEKISQLTFNPVVKNLNNRTDFKGGCASPNEPWLSEAGLYLREEILRRGFKISKMAPSACRIEIENNIVINYDGSILKCPAFMGIDGFDAGHVKTGIKDYHESHKLDIWKRDECLDCEYLPMCYGGCRYLKLLKDGNIDGVDCKKTYLDATLETLVKQDLKYSQKTLK